MPTHLPPPRTIVVPGLTPRTVGWCGCMFQAAAGLIRALAPCATLRVRRKMSWNGLQTRWQTACSTSMQRMRPPKNRYAGKEPRDAAFRCGQPRKSLPLHHGCRQRHTDLYHACVRSPAPSGWEAARERASPEAAGGSGAGLPSWDEHCRREGKLAVGGGKLPVSRCIFRVF